MQPSKEGAEGIEDDDKKQDEGEPNVNDREIEPPPARANTNNGLSLRKDKKLTKTNEKQNRTPDIRAHFKQKSDSGIT